MTTPSPCAWQGSVSEFLATPEERVLSDLTAFLRETGAPQILAWDRSLRVLRDELRSCLPDAAGFALVLEFELPRSGGRRPDLIVLENGLVLVIEFKNRIAAEPADIAQVKGYVRDLEEYHAACRGKTLVPLLVPIGMDGDPETRDGVRIVPSRKLGAVIRELSRGGAGKRGDGDAFVRAPFEPLPALVEAAQLLFEKKPLPRIRAAESARIPETVARLERLARDVRGTGKRTLALVSGVPGSGKTLVGLQLVHSRDLGVPAVFLSGNGPLVNVLQYVLESREFVRDMKKFIHDHLVRTQSPPREPVVVFDEAQRAWDRDRVLKKHRGALADGEPALLARIAGRVKRAERCGGRTKRIAEVRARRSGNDAQSEKRGESARGLRSNGYSTFAKGISSESGTWEIQARVDERPMKSNTLSRTG